MATIAFTGGGTGGHIYPGLAVATELKKFHTGRVFWIGSSSGMDKAIVENAGIDFFSIPTGKLRRYFSLRNIFDVFKVAAGFFSARKILKREAARLLFSKGGFVSVPPCAAAKSLKIPVFTHESDFSPGLATRINAKFAERIFVPYKETAAFFPDKIAGKIRVSGNPIRSSFAAADPKKGRAFLSVSDDERLLLVLGGSLGSQEINALVKACLPMLTKHYTVVHQTGENNFREIKPSIDEPSIKPSIKLSIDDPSIERYKPYPYFRDEIPHVIAAAELIICRSGAGTIWECKYLKKPMVLIPFRGGGTRGDQVENARLFEEAGAAISFIPDKADSPEAERHVAEKLAADKLSGLVISLAEDPEKRLSMGEAKISCLDAAALIAKEISDRIE